MKLETTTHIPTSPIHPCATIEVNRTIMQKSKPKPTNILDSYARLAQERTREDNKAGEQRLWPFSAQRLHHWCEAALQGPEELTSIFKRIPERNWWAIPLHNAKVNSVTVVLIECAHILIHLLDPGKSASGHTKALLSIMVSKFCEVKCLLYQSAAWSFQSIQCLSYQSTNSWLQITFIFAIESFLQDWRPKYSTLTSAKLGDLGSKLFKECRILTLIDTDEGAFQAGFFWDRAEANPLSDRCSTPRGPTIARSCLNLSSLEQQWRQSSG